MPCKCLETKDYKECCPPFNIGSIRCKRHILNIAFAFSTNPEYTRLTYYGKFNKINEHFNLGRTVNYFAILVKHFDIVPYSVMERIYQTDASNVEEFKFLKSHRSRMIKDLKQDIDWLVKNETTNKKLNIKLEELTIKKNNQEFLDFYRILEKIKYKEAEEQDIIFTNAYE